MLTHLLRHAAGALSDAVRGRLTHAGERIDALDNLRGVAILMVMLTHAWGAAGGPAFMAGGTNLSALIEGGRFGVDLFFVLSGYLLFSQYVRRHEAGEPQASWRAFWTRRIRRVVPAYYVTALIAFALVPAAFMPNGPGGSRLEGLVSHLLFLHNLDLRYVQSMPAVWSLAAEMQFYLVMPLLCAILLRGRRWRWNVTAAWLASIALSYFVLDNDTLLQFRLNQFLAGFVAAAWLPYAARSGWVAAHRRKAARALQIAGAAGIVALMFADYTLRWVISPDASGVLSAVAQRRIFTAGLFAEHPLMAAAMALLLAGALLQPDWPARLWRWRWLGLAGMISYGAFLWHGYAMGPLMQSPLLGSIASPLARLISAYAVIGTFGIMMGWLSYVLIEAPFITARHAPAAAPPSHV